MPSLFTKIIQGKIPCHKILEDDNYLAFLKKNATDIQILGSLKDIESFLDDDEVLWDDRSDKLQNIKKEFTERYDVKIIQDGLYDEKNKWIALYLIEKLNIAELKNDIRSLLDDSPYDVGLISALRKIGDKEDVEFMFKKIP